MNNGLTAIVSLAALSVSLTSIIVSLLTLADRKWGILDAVLSRLRLSLTGECVLVFGSAMTLSVIGVFGLAWLIVTVWR